MIPYRRAEGKGEAAAGLSNCLAEEQARNIIGSGTLERAYRTNLAVSLAPNALSGKIGEGASGCHQTVVDLPGRVPPCCCGGGYTDESACGAARFRPGLSGQRSYPRFRSCAHPSAMPPWRFRRRITNERQFRLRVLMGITVGAARRGPRTQSCRHIRLPISRYRIHTCGRLARRPFCCSRSAAVADWLPNLYFSFRLSRLYGSATTARKSPAAPCNFALGQV